MFTSKTFPDLCRVITLATFQSLTNDQEKINKFIIKARESQMTGTPVFKECDVIPSIPEALFALIV